jgi:SAM-dependent methyltransferase
MNHHYLGGRETFQADRDAAERVLAAEPAMRAAAVAARQFTVRAVRFLAAEAGVDQFLDIGTGLPAAPALHEVARQVSPDARVAYVDYDPVVVSHGNALLARPDVAVVVRGDLRQPADLLERPEIRAHLDFGRPVAVLLVSVLQFVADRDDPRAIVAAIRAALAPGSFLVLSHVSGDLMADEDAARRVVTAYQRANAPAWPRPRAEVLRFFDGFDLVEPGLVTNPGWRPDPGTAPPTAPGLDWCGVARLRPSP